MKKIIPQTTDITQQNIDKIAQLFPQAITEKEDENGNTVKAIDFELLKQHLSKEIVEGSDERYRLDWPGKRASILKANTPITSTLKPDRESSVNFDTTENVYIEGDNFEVLKILQESYLGKIKMIYIDPPYNTGKDFVYNDNFTQDKDEYNEEIELVDEEGKKQFKPKPNTDTNGRFHSDWLSMMYERLLLARDLLTEDGVIFISIDDNEVHNLRKLAEEIFGEENFVGEFIRQSKIGGGSDSKFIVKEHEYCISYSKSINSLDEFYTIHNEDYLKRYKESDEKGRYFWDTLARGGLKNPIRFEVEAPDGSKLTNNWNRAKNTFYKDLESGEIKFKKNKDNNWNVYFKQRLNINGKKPRSLTSELGSTIDGKNDIKSIFTNDKIFSYPKPTKLINFLNNLIKDNNNSIILDFFSGSATTAHATMQLNAEDGGRRKFIMVQLPEETESSSEAYKSGYKTIPEIGKERIRRAGKKILEENSEKLKERETPLDIGFRVYKTTPTILKEVSKHPNEVTQVDLFSYQDNIKEEATSEDILTAVLLDFGLTLDNVISKKQVEDSTIFMVDENALVACFDKEIDMQVVDTMANLKPLRAVFRDACFAEDKDLINTVESRFKQITPDTKVHVI